MLWFKKKLTLNNLMHAGIYIWGDIYAGKKRVTELRSDYSFFTELYV